MVGDVHDVITCFKFQIEIFMGYDYTGGQILDFLIDYCMGFTTVQRYCTACDSTFLVCVLLGTVANRGSVLECLRKDLRHMVDPDFGLPAKLMEKEVLTEDERRSVKSKDSPQKKNDVLLDFVLQKNEAAQWRFIECLNYTDQQHVQNFIQCDGGKQFVV